MPPDVAALLRAKRTPLIERWQRRVAEMTEALHVSRIELLDHMPLFIDGVIALLADGTSDSEEPGREAGPQHGAQRLGVGFDVDEVIREYGLLSDVMLEILDEANLTLSSAQQRRFFSALNAGAAEAVREYVERRDDELAREQSRHRAFVAHELRTPLSAALAAHQVLSTVRPDVVSLRPMHLLGRCLAHVRDLVDQVLIAGRLDAGVEPELAEVDLSALVRDLIETVQPEAEARDVELAVDLPTAVRAHADARLIQSAISNLVRNAVKYTKPRTQVAVTLKTLDDGSVLLQVRDACGGITASNWAEIFEPYARGADASTRRSDGLGLGLAIAKQAAEAHGGSLSVQNLDGEGCLFELRMPGLVVSP